MSSHRDVAFDKSDAAVAPANLAKSAGGAAARWFPVVGIGASAGGLDAFKALLAALPPDPGMAFVLIQHLDPLHDSLMAGLLSSHTTMPVTPAAEGVAVEPNHVYLIPPGVSLAVAQGKLHLSEPTERHGARMAFDFFLRSLAEDCGERAICVVLSGTGTDGSEGLKAVKKKGGFVIVQDPSEAAFDGMPKSAIKTGEADLILPAAGIPGALIDHAGGIRVHPSVAKLDTNGEIENRFLEILDLVRRKTRQDFSLYKAGTLERRIERRMAMAGVADVTRYIERLQSDPAELDNLGHDLLINVTEFFRDPAAFEALAASVIPDLVSEQALDRPLRIWVPGCSTGEEVYSLTILFLEAIEASKRNIKLQVFASDVDAHSVAFARAGLYGPETAARVDGKRLARFFLREGKGYRVVRDLREAVVFTVQDLLADPPFSRLDLISCRNLLIYLRPSAQEQILSLFHFALRAGGVLFLGRSETVGKFAERFEPLNKKQRIYRHLSAGRPGEVDFRASATLKERLAPAIAPAPRRMTTRVDFEDLASKHLLEAFAPPSVLVDKKYDALFYSGAVDRYLQVAPGEANRNILVMAREGLRPKLRAALEGARETGTSSWKTGGLIRREGKAFGVKIGVQPLPADDMFLVSFVEEREPAARASEANALPEDSSRIVQLEQELEATRKELNAVIRDLEVSNEDLRAVNEEALSINEEFQSANEELETSKEELQALNEELTALNAQLHESLEQQRATAADLENILNSSDVATLFLDAAFKIRFFTPAAKSFFGVSSVDIGRPVADLAQRFHDGVLLQDARAVLSDLTPMRREIETHDGNFYIRSILPYRVAAGAVEGVVITFARISEMKAAERKIEAAKAYAESIIATVKQPLAVLDEDLRMVSASASYFKVFEVKPEDSIGRPFTLGTKHQPEALAKFLEAANEGSAIENYEVSIDLPHLGLRTFLFSARRIASGPSERPKILISIDDITDAKIKSEALAAAKEEAERANLGKSRFLAAASHDLRQPLQTLSLLQGMLADSIQNPGASKLIERLDKTIVAMSGLLDKLLDINQLEAGVVQPKFSDFAIGDLLKRLQDEFEIHAAHAGLSLRVAPCRLTVHSDPRLLEQILRNMLSNATKYTSQGKVLLGCRRRGERLSIEVWDTGTGIPETELSAIFKEFHQLENQAGRRTKGLGLGLAIVQRIADLLGVPISVHSRLGRGSVFAVEVPMVHAPALIEPAASSPAEAIHEEPPARAQTILIVEDDAEVRETLTLLLNSRGYRTFAASDGAHALAIAAERGVRLDFIVADYNLPGANGLEIAGKIQESSARKIPVIILTGDISAAKLLEIASKGHAHLYKPADARTLIRRIGEMLAANRREAGAPTIFVVDDDREIREAMRDMLEMHGYRTEIFADGSSFLNAYSPGRSGCLLTDARMPGMGGLELIEQLNKMQAPLPVIMITAYGDIAIAVKAMKAGAFDFLQKPAKRKELLDCIERALNYSPNHPDHPDHPDHPSIRQAATAKIESLTARQRQILDLVLAGSPSKNIASDLRISQRTVDNHRAAIMRKTGAKSLSALIRIALAGGWMDKPVVAPPPHKQIPNLS
ncbi:MAG: chemotaxis protein CheB [Rhodomicrobium sp.]